MGETNLQLGGGYIYQWECATLLAINYLFEPVSYNDTLHDLVTNFLGEVKEIHLEGRDQQGDVELEDICLVCDQRRILIQVKTKQVAWGHWTLTDPLLLKSLTRFYTGPLLTTQPENTRFVFLTNRPFNHDLVQVQSAIHERAMDPCPEADRLLQYVKNYAMKEYEKTVDPARFWDMLARTALTEFLAVDVVKANVQAKLQAYGRADWQQAYNNLFEHFSRESTRVGGSIITRESMSKVLGPGTTAEPGSVIEQHARAILAALAEQGGRSITRDWLKARLGLGDEDVDRALNHLLGRRLVRGTPGSVGLWYLTSEGAEYWRTDRRR